MAHVFPSIKDKKSISHFQNLFIYYRAEVVTDLREKLLKHESRLADIMTKREQFSKQFTALNNDFFKFIEKLK